MNPYASKGAQLVERLGRRTMLKLMIYGATGYVGEHVARTAARAGMALIVAGRNRAKLDHIFGETSLERRAFGLEDPAAVDRALTGVSVLLNCAGPFDATAQALAEACLRSRTHYLDITGEIPVYEMLQRHDGQAKSVGVLLLPGVGFDVAPTDCLALHLKQRLPSATHLRIAFQSVGPAGLPPGTQRTAIHMLHHGGRIRVDGKLIKPPTNKVITVDFGNGPVRAEPLAWGDVFTAYYSTGIGNIYDYIAASGPLRLQLALGRVLAPVSRIAPIRRLLLATIQPGANAEQRAKTRMHVWAEVTDEGGKRAVARLHGPEAGLDWTTITALGAVSKVLAGVAPAGYQTPASAFGADFVLDGEGVAREDIL